jgi:hypothetical protein
VVIPIQGWDRVAEKAIQFGMMISDDVTAVHITTEKDNESLRNLWATKVEAPARSIPWPIPKLEIIYSPYRQIYQPILDFVKSIKKKKPGRIIAVIIPELIEPHWYERLLHNVHAAGLRALLFFERDQRTIVITTPWYLRE